MTPILEQMIKQYITERYGTGEVGTEKVHRCLDYWKSLGAFVDDFMYGFIAQKKQGDAHIIYDLYVMPEHRRTKIATKVFELICKTTNANVIITCSDFAGQNRNLGLNAIKSVGFIPYMRTNNKQWFIRGN